eukprot:15441864-Alexandrium_andersonii.AAC.1
MGAGETLPRAEAIPVAEVRPDEPVSGSPPRAEEPPVAQAELRLPFARFPGLVNAGNPVMQACYEAWTE